MKNIIKEYLPYVIAIVMIVLIKTYVITTIKVNGDSMNNTLKNGDIMLLDKISYKLEKINRFDIVVVDLKDTKIIKRVIALPNEEVKYEDNKLIINNKVIENVFFENYTEDFESFILKEDEYFIMGDNRGNSLDSRIIGPIKKNSILGKASFVVLPFSRFGNKK